MATAGKAIAAANTASNAAIAATETAMWSTPATLATIASYGGAAVAAPMEIAMALMETMGMSLASFEVGGATGGRRGRLAGLVHGEEFVFSAPAVDAIGPGNLERMHQKALSGWSSRGMAPAGGSRGGSGGTGGNLVVALDPASAARAMRQHTDARYITVRDFSKGSNRTRF